MLVLISSALNATGESLVSLDSLRWKNRVLLIFAPEPLASAARSNLEKSAAGIEERDLVFFLLNGDALQTNYPGNVEPGFRDWLLDKYFTPLPKDTLVYLIGKDGGVKSTGPDLDLEATFGLIDQMPMRQREMRQAGEALD